VSNFTLTAAQQVEYDALVKAQYRSSGWKLRGSMRMKENVVGNTVQFRVMGNVTSVPTGYSQRVTGQDPGLTTATATLVKHTTPIYGDTVEELVVNFDSKMESVAEIGRAMGKRSDQIGIDALSAATYAATPTDTQGTLIAAGTTGFDYTKYTQLIEAFEDRGVPLEDRFLAVKARQFRQLLASDQFINSFYTNNRVIDYGMLRDYFGVNFILIPAMTEGGLPNGAGGATEDRAFAWHRMALGMGVGMNFRAEVNYVPEVTSWLANGIFSAGAVVIDPRGVVAIDSLASA
jgi:hypothetical protein